MISIIIPIYNREKYIDKCIESILAQTYTDWELILVDDGSTDSSGEIAESYAKDNERISVIHVENGGMSWARNKGIEKTKGEYITFLDSDDELYPDSLKALLTALEGNDAEISIGSFVYGEKKDKIPGNVCRERLYDSKEAIEDVLFQKKLLPSAWGKIYKRSLFDKIRFREGIYYEDLDLFYKLFLEAKKIVYIDTPVYFYRDTPGSILHEWKPKRLDVLEVTKRMEVFLEKTEPSLVRAARDRRLSANFNMFCLATIHGEKEIADGCWRLIKCYRKESLLNKKVRLKNKAGIILSYFGKRFFGFIGKIIYM